ncbi:porin family protein [Parachryseolinea silvisoli]|jgi:outer membrane protein|uniref:porin family protein n=1 Tax=Parachryseolinea silvisoli TaxID=2873601 RepID=UPI002265B18C|nr:porin family protein [Parachryseolinea silvisoli]MCD9018358.1 porin family protein [Parachryseolinea silvisoli]
MKKLLSICVLAVGVAGYAQAQTTAGNMLLGGGIGYTSQKQETAGDDATNNTFSFTPSFGYFVADNFAVGLNLDFASSNRENWDEFNGEYKVTDFLFEPFARYYMFTPNDKFAFFVEGALGFGSRKVDPEDFDETKSGMFRFRASPGFAYFISDKWSLDFELSGISYTSVDPDKDSDSDDDKQSEFVFGVDSFNPTLGFRYIIGN